MPKATLTVQNARSKIEGLRPEAFKLLSYELAYPVAEPGQRVYPQRDGSAKVVHWDGFARLLRKTGQFPSGLVPRVIRLLRKWRIGVEIRDARKRPAEAVPRWSFADGFQLRDYQAEACERGIQMTRGVFDSPPRTGKTVMMAEMARQVADTTVITAPTVPIAKQTHEKLLELLVRHGEGWSKVDADYEIQLLTGGPPKSQKARRQLLRAVITVCTAETATAMSKTWWGKVRCLMVDERHHQAALKTYGKMNDLAVEAFWRWGFTGTNFRSNPLEQVALEACLGRTVASYSIGDMRRRGVLVPGQVRFVAFQTPRIGASVDFQGAYERGVTRCQSRNEAVAREAVQLQREGRKVLVLVQRLEHGERLENLIPGSKFVQADDGDEVRKVVEDLDRGELTCVIGSPVVGEGLDIPSADALIYAKGMKARVTHTQDTFRVLTGGAGKEDAVVVDFLDRHNAKLIEHAIERMRNYHAMGMEVTVDNQGGQQSPYTQLGFGLDGGSMDNNT